MQNGKFNILRLAQQIPTEAAAYEFLEDLRWNGQPVCPHCGSVRKHYFLTPKNGTSRKTRTGADSERRVWKCADCRKQFSVLTNTIFHGTKIPVRMWVLVVFEMCASKNGVAAREIERKYGLTPKTSWHMLHRIREAMKREPMAGMLSGRVIVDETYFGGMPSNRHGYKPQERMPGQTDKIKILALVSRETGEVRSRVIPDVTGETLRNVLIEHVDAANTHLHTDEARYYPPVARAFASHSTVNHRTGEYVSKDGATTNQAENYFAQLKRSIDGTHHHVSREHLARYLAEFDFRFSTCKATDTDRMRRLLARRVAGRRLTYRPASA
jgi:transposase-like protein